MRRAGARVPPPRFDRVAAVVQRLAVLLSAGIPPESAWRHAAAADGPDSVTARVVALAHAGMDLSATIREVAVSCPPEERSAWEVLAAAWSVASEVGAPLAPTLMRLAEVLRALAHAAREVDLALAGPTATARIVLVLPPLGLLVGLALGANPFGILLTTPLGLICAAGGSALVLAAGRWSGRLVRAARTTDPTPGVACDLLAIGLSGGRSPDRAIHLVDAALRGAGLPTLGPDARSLLEFAASAGVPAAGLLRAEADEQRRIAQAESRRRAELLGTRLLLPLGLCVLPAFALLGVVPVVIAIVSTTVTGW
jgi:tight adherence protein B